MPIQSAYNRYLIDKELHGSSDLEINLFAGFGIKFVSDGDLLWSVRDDNVSDVGEMTGQCFFLRFLRNVYL